MDYEFTHATLPKKPEDGLSRFQILCRPKNKEIEHGWMIYASIECVMANNQFVGNVVDALNAGEI